MEIDQNLIKHLLIKVERDNKAETDRLDLYITIWTFLRNMEIKDAKPEDFHNSLDRPEAKLGILSFNINLGLPENVEISNELIAVNKLIKVRKSDGFEFKFDNENNNIFIAQVKLNIKPEGTKRTVITYEDSDVIDDTI